MKALVIGAGFGGIAAALRLRAKGYEVALIDRCAGLGGRAQVFERHGFTHDAGPTVITAPFLFEELFALFGERFEDHVKLMPLTPGTGSTFQTTTSSTTAAHSTKHWPRLRASSPLTAMATAACSYSPRRYSTSVFCSYQPCHSIALVRCSGKFRHCFGCAARTLFGNLFAGI